MQQRPTLQGKIGWAVLAVVAVYVAALAWHLRVYFVDDAFIGFQYVDNLLAGEGFVFRPGETPVEGVTNVGWLLVLTSLSAVGGPILAAKLAGLVFLLAALTLTMLLSRACGVCVSSALQVVPLLLAAVSFDFVYFSLAGMETALLATLLLLMAWLAMRRASSPWLPILGGLAFLAHPEAVVVYPLYVLLSFCCGEPCRVGQAQRAPPETGQIPIGGARCARPTLPRQLAGGMLILAVFVGIVTAARFAYFGDAVPNTFHSKPSDVRQIVQNAYEFLMGRNTNVAFPVTGWLALPVLLLGYVRLRRTAPSAAAMLAAISGTGLMFAIYSQPDWTITARYFAPYLPVALMVLWAGIVEAVELLLGMSRRLVVAVIALMLMLTSIFDGTTKMSQLEEYPGYILAGKNLVPPSLWLRDHLPQDATIATRRIGALAYYSGRRIFDYTYGLPDRDMARLVAHHGRRFDTPTDPALADLWRSRAPEYLMEDGPVMDYIISCAGGSRERFSIHGLEYRVIQRFPIGSDAEWVLAGLAARSTPAD